MRYTPDDPAFAGDFVEFSDSWSRAQADAAWAAWRAIPSTTVGLTAEEIDATEEGLLAALRPKIVALRLTCEGAPPITNPADLTPARTSEMDMRLYGWWANVWMVHMRELTTLGNALRERLFATSAPKATTTTTKPNDPRHRKRS